MGLKMCVVALFVASTCPPSDTLMTIPGVKTEQPHTITSRVLGCLVRAFAGDHRAVDCVSKHLDPAFKFDVLDYLKAHRLDELGEVVPVDSKKPDPYNIELTFRVVKTGDFVQINLSGNRSPPYRIVGLLACKQVFTAIPPGGSPCNLPQKKIIDWQRF